MNSDYVLAKNKGWYKEFSKRSQKWYQKGEKMHIMNSHSKKTSFSTQPKVEGKDFLENYSFF